MIREQKNRLIATGAVLAGAVLFWPSSKMGGYKNPLDRLFELREIKTKKVYHPWDQRLLIWSCSYSMIQDHIILGKGWGLMELFYPYYQGPRLFNENFRPFRTHANNSHNEMLEIWSQTGFLGMGVYVWIWVVFIVFGLKMARSDLSADGNDEKAGKQTQTDSRDKQLWSWALACASVGMLVDNFFGNVSPHFCVPGFLFWWQSGLLFGMEKLRSGKRMCRCRLGTIMCLFRIFTKGAGRRRDSFQSVGMFI